MSLPLSLPDPSSPAARPAAVGHTNALPPGARFGEFEVLGVLGEGGFGIVYRAMDHSLQRVVALKEYMPAQLAARTQALSVALRSDDHRETFAVGLRSFVNEARLLAQFDHPALVKVFRFWEGNGTAYMVMPLYEGGTLKQALRDRWEPPDETWLRHLLVPLLDALELLHQASCLHRDVSPDNILLVGGDRAEPRPVLLDFGAARQVIGETTQALTVILKPGFAPIEQYDEIPGMKQGPWTDLYALGAVLHFAMVGRAPPPSVGRMVSDAMKPLGQLLAGRYSPSFLAAIDALLVAHPGGRPQNVGQLRELLGAGERTITGVARTVTPDPVRAVPLPAPSSDAPTVALGRPPAAPAPSAPPPARVGSVPAPAPATAPAAAQPARPERAADPERRTGRAAPATAVPRPRRAAWTLPVGGLALVALGAAAWFALRGPATDPPAPLAATPAPTTAAALPPPAATGPIAAVPPAALPAAAQADRATAASAPAPASGSAAPGAASPGVAAGAPPTPEPSAPTVAAVPTANRPPAGPAGTRRPSPTAAPRPLAGPAAAGPTGAAGGVAPAPRPLPSAADPGGGQGPAPAPATPAGAAGTASGAAAGTGGTRLAAAPDRLTGVGGTSVASALREATECLAVRRYDCTLAKTGEVLRVEPGNDTAARLAAQARAGQAEALKGDWNMR